LQQLQHISKDFVACESTAKISASNGCEPQGAGDAKVSGDEAAEYTVVRDGVASAADAATAGQEDEANGDGAGCTSASNVSGF